jgi:large subunit ribosomal protein L6
MSRVGKKPVVLPAGVKLAVDGRTVRAEGPKGKLSLALHPTMKVRVEGNQVFVERPDDERLSRSLHGTTRNLIANMLAGVLNGFEKKLELYGVGYSVALQGKTFSLTCGFSNSIQLTVPDGVQVEVTTPQARGDAEPARFAVRGCDKQQVGEFAARCRRARKPEPYKGKGVRYAGEHVTRKVGKAFAGAGGAS